RYRLSRGHDRPAAAEAERATHRATDLDKGAASSKATVLVSAVGRERGDEARTFLGRRVAGLWNGCARLPQLPYHSPLPSARWYSATNSLSETRVYRRVDSTEEWPSRRCNVSSRMPPSRMRVAWVCRRLCGVTHGSPMPALSRARANILAS